MHDWGYGLSSHRTKPSCSEDGYLSACEHQIVASRKANLCGKRVVSLVSVKDMSKPPHNFSEQLGLQ